MADWGCALHDNSIDEVNAGKRKVPHMCTYTSFNTAVWIIDIDCAGCVARNRRNEEGKAAQSLFKKGQRRE